MELLISASFVNADDSPETSFINTDDDFKEWATWIPRLCLWTYRVHEHSSHLEPTETR